MYLYINSNLPIRVSVNIAYHSLSLIPYSFLAYPSPKTWTNLNLNSVSLTLETLVFKRVKPFKVRSRNKKRIETKSFVRFTTPCTCARNLLLLCFVLAIIQNTIEHQLARQSERINKTWLNGHLSSNIIIRHGKSCKHASAACGQFLRKLWTFIENTMFSLNCPKALLACLQLFPCLLKK